jgi:hypothetical protein
MGIREQSYYGWEEVFNLEKQPSLSQLYRINSLFNSVAVDSNGNIIPIKDNGITLET